MRTTAGLLLASAFCCVPALAQDGFTYAFSGRIGIGWLDTLTASQSGRGYRYNGYVLGLEGTASANFESGNTLNFGAVAGFKLQEGQYPNYEANSAISGISANKFDSQDVNLAAYLSWDPVTISYGEMQTAFSYATRKVDQGGSILDGGNAVWQGIGDGTGNLGSFDSTADGPGQANDYLTLRADLALSDFVFSFSKSRLSSSPFPSRVEGPTYSTGVFWERDVGDGRLFLGTAVERGHRFEFRSSSFEWSIDGLNLVMNRIARVPTSEISGTVQDARLDYTGFSASYSADRIEVGVATGRQLGGFFSGDAHAVWVSWKPVDDVSIDLEVSDNNFRDPTTQDTSKASLAVSYSF